MITVIIPTLNAAPFLAASLAAIEGVPEVIVVDGGSADATMEQASAAGARVMSAPRGRGGQIAAGVAAASHPWLLLLHADTRLSPDWRCAIHEDPSRAGYFRFVLDSPDPRARRLERLVAWRCRRFGLPFGDQGLLVHRDLLASVGGIRVRRLGHDRVIALPADAVTSAVKWERQGYVRRSARNLLCLSLWFVGVPPGLIARLYG
jgi:glycosyltransferase involved in cell wall biosynthesis